MTSLTVAIDACYILLASQRFRYSKYHSFELQSCRPTLHSNTPFYSENNAESIAILQDTIFEKNANSWRVVTNVGSRCGKKLGSLRDIRQAF